MIYFIIGTSGPISRDAEKRALQLARAEQQQHQQQINEPKTNVRVETKEPLDSNREPPSDKENVSPTGLSTFRSEDDTPRKKSPRPGSGPKYPGSILHGAYYQRREKRKVNYSTQLHI